MQTEQIKINDEDNSSYITIESINYPLSSISKSTFEQFSAKFKDIKGIPRVIYVEDKDNNEPINFYLFPIPDNNYPIKFIHNNIIFYTTSEECRNTISHGD